MSPTVRIKGQVFHDGGEIDLDVEDVRLADGTRLTEARAQELAEEITEKARSGRPSLTEPGVHSPLARKALPGGEILRRGQSPGKRLRSLEGDQCQAVMAEGLFEYPADVAGGQHGSRVGLGSRHTLGAL
ncbi:MAG: hypothetical protein ACRDZ5_12685, partial [Acidimicrobiales bacterium]